MMKESTTKRPALRWICRVIRREIPLVVLLTAIHMAQGVAGIVFAFALRSVVNVTAFWVR
jgi:hypothetical protein